MVILFIGHALKVTRSLVELAMLRLQLNVPSKNATPSLIKSDRNDRLHTLFNLLGFKSSWNVSARSPRKNERTKIRVPSLRGVSWISRLLRPWPLDEKSPRKLPESGLKRSPSVAQQSQKRRYRAMTKTLVSHQKPSWTGSGRRPVKVPQMLP